MPWMIRKDLSGGVRDIDISTHRGMAPPMRRSRPLRLFGLICVYHDSLPRCRSACFYPTPSRKRKSMHTSLGTPLEDQGGRPCGLSNFWTTVHTYSARSLYR